MISCHSKWKIVYISQCVHKFDGYIVCKLYIQRMVEHRFCQMFSRKFLEPTKVYYVGYHILYQQFRCTEPCFGNQLILYKVDASLPF